MKEKDQGVSVDIIINDFSTNPRCTHGPTVMFERFQTNGTSRVYYACAACRDRKDCSFYHLADEKYSQAKTELWQSIIKQSASKGRHINIYNRLKPIKVLPDTQRSYCLTCSTLLGAKKSGHEHCKLKSSVSDSELSRPTSFLPPKDNPKAEAQFMFSESSVEVILGMLKQVDAKKVLCLGTPRIFEAIVNSPEEKMSGLLMDIDDRYASFFSPSQYVQYNMFNHHFFDEGQKKNSYLEFLTGKKKLVIVADPPFGGRMELLGHSLKTIEKDWRTANNLPEDKQLSVLFIFPYFNEPQVLDQLPNLVMLDYQVDYDNHPLYSSGPQGMMNGSAVRVYVNDAPSLFAMPGDKGYRLCQPCDRWVRSTNTHCQKCKGCMSKDGRTYTHCGNCKKCVKPNWIHCAECKKCQPQCHKCGVAASIVCHACGKEGHRRADCDTRKKYIEKLQKNKKSIKRKSDASVERNGKKQKVEGNVNKNDKKPKMEGNVVKKAKKQKIDNTVEKNTNDSALSNNEERKKLKAKKKNKVKGSAAVVPNGVTNGLEEAIKMNENGAEKKRALPKIMYKMRNKSKKGSFGKRPKKGSGPNKGSGDGTKRKRNHPRRGRKTNGGGKGKGQKIQKK